jgi:hypothetical protein
MRFERRTLYRVIFAAWLALWVFYEAWYLMKGEYFAKYCAIIGKDREERRAVIYGREFGHFLRVAKNEIGGSTTYRIAGLSDGSIDIVRAQYYLYPALMCASAPARAILVWNTQQDVPAGYRRIFFFREGGATGELYMIGTPGVKR